MRCRLKMRFIISFELLCVIYELMLSSSISAERNFDINIGKYMYTGRYDCRPRACACVCVCVQGGGGIVCL